MPRILLLQAALVILLGGVPAQALWVSSPTSFLAGRTALPLHGLPRRSFAGASVATASGGEAADPVLVRSAASRISPWPTLLRLTRPDALLVLAALIALVLAATGEAMLPGLQGAALNAALNLQPQGDVSLHEALKLLAVTGVFTALCTGIRGVLFWFAGARLVARLRSVLFDTLLKQPQAFHDEQSPGELSSRLATDCVVCMCNVRVCARMRVYVRAYFWAYVGACVYNCTCGICMCTHVHAYRFNAYLSVH